MGKSWKMSRKPLGFRWDLSVFGGFYDVSVGFAWFYLSMIRVAVSYGKA